MRIKSVILGSTALAAMVLAGLPQSAAEQASEPAGGEAGAGSAEADTPRDDEPCAVVALRWSVEPANQTKPTSNTTEHPGVAEAVGKLPANPAPSALYPSQSMK